MKKYFSNHSIQDYSWKSRSYCHLIYNKSLLTSSFSLSLYCSTSWDHKYLTSKRLGDLFCLYDFHMTDECWRNLVQCLPYLRVFAQEQIWKGVNCLRMSCRMTTKQIYFRVSRVPLPCHWVKDSHKRELQSPLPRHRDTELFKLRLRSSWNPVLCD